MDKTDHLKSDIAELIPALIVMRRDLHAHPELAFEEVRTSGIVAQRLQSLGLEVQTGIAKTGVLGLLRGEASKPGFRTIAIRADMDALPIHEMNNIEYRSSSDGKMHACGHDGHTAILLAVADLLSRRRAELTGNVKFVFQPAEEYIGGAKLMVNEGVMKGVDGIIGLHLGADRPFGTIGVRSGSVYASSDSFVLTVKGNGGHAAWPHASVDPIVIAASLITALQTLTSRETSPFSPAVITIGQFIAGSAWNIIPETAVLRGTVRSFSYEHREKLIRRIREVANGIASVMGGRCEVTFLDGCPPCINDPDVTKIIRKVSIDAVGEEHVYDSEAVIACASDDMAIFLQMVPGCYCIVGAQNEQKGASFPHHHSRFNIDEDALPIGVEVLTRAALEYLKETPSEF